MSSEKSKNIEMITGDPKKAIVKLAIPMMVSMLLIMLYNLADSIWVAGLGADALAAIGFIVDRDKLGTVLKKGSLYGFGAGVLNGAKNFLTLVIYLYLPISIISPVKMGLGIVGSFAIAFLFFKEKYTKKQLLGVALGVAAIIILTI